MFGFELDLAYWHDAAHSAAVAAERIFREVEEIILHRFRN